MFDIIVDEEEEKLVELHRLCKYNQVSYTLDSNEGENTYDLIIISPSIKENKKFNDYAHLFLLVDDLNLFFKSIKDNT